MSQYWKQNSVAINTDDIVWIESSCVNHDERIVLKITDCLLEPRQKTHFRAKLTLKEVKSLAAMFKDIADHYKEMDRVAKEE